MRNSLAPLAALAFLAAPALAHAQDVTALLHPVATTTAPPADDPHAFTPAPVPRPDRTRVAPTERAGGAADAGPMDATPFSGSLSTVLTGSQSARALDNTAPDRYPSAATQWRD